MKQISKISIISGLLSLFLGAAAWRGTYAVIAEALKKANKQERMVTRSQGGGFLKGFNQEGEKRIAEVKCIPATSVRHQPLVALRCSAVTCISLTVLEVERQTECDRRP